MSLWASDLYAALYSSISLYDHDTQLKLLRELPKDSLLNLVEHPNKSESARKLLESKKVMFSDGMEYELNQSFIEDAIRISDTLNIDEKVAAEILYYALNGNINAGVNSFESALIAWYDRNTFILQVLSYYLNSNVDQDGNANMSGESINNPKYYILDLLKSSTKFSSKIIASMKLIGEELEEIKRQIDRLKVLGEYQLDSFQMKNITFRRDILFKHHQLLGEIMYGYYANFLEEVQLDEYKAALNHVQQFDPSDMFALSYLPALSLFVTSIDRMEDTKVDSIHKEFISNLNNLEVLADSPFKAFVMLEFFSSFIGWCKADTTRSLKYEFFSSVEDPMQKLIAIGALEQFLTISADTSIVESTGEGKPFFNFRGFFQRHVPMYCPIRCLDIDEQATTLMQRELATLSTTTISQIEKSKPLYITAVKAIKPDPHFTEFILKSLNEFVCTFVTNAAFMLTTLRDQEEDLLLSNDSDIQGISENADLERAYLGMFYLYSQRPNLSAQFWVNTEANFTNNNLYGFLQWGSKCNSPLIMASYSMFLSSLASSQRSAENVFTFLQTTNSESNGTNTQSGTLQGVRNSGGLLLKYGSVSWATIYSSLSYYSNQLKSLLAPQNIEHSFGSESKTSDGTINSNVIVAELGKDSVLYLSSLFAIISSVAKQSPQARRELLESDDGQIIGLLQSILVGVGENVIKGSILKIFSTLIGSDSIMEMDITTKEETCKFERETREKVWNVLDSWIFGATTVGLPKDRFSKLLNSYPLINGFTTLLTSLLSSYPDYTNCFKQLDLSFSVSLGSNVHLPGIHIYLEFLIKEVLPSIAYSASDRIVSKEEKNILHLAILRLISRLLNSINPAFVEACQAAGLKEMDDIISSDVGGVVSYLQAHPCSSVMRCIYESQVYETIFKIANVGIDNLNQFAPDSMELNLVKEALLAIELIITHDSFYIDNLAPILRLKDNKFMDPAEIGSGTAGLRSFDEAFLLNLDFVVNVSLYLGASDLTACKSSLKIFNHICQSKLFNLSSVNGVFNYQSSKKKRMLIMLETVEESDRIREAWIAQFEASIDYNSENFDQLIEIKISILEFLLATLNETPETMNATVSSANFCPTVSHFLLGFDTFKLRLGSEAINGTINSSRSLLKSIISLLCELTTSLGSYQISYFAARISSLSVELLLSLTKATLLRDPILKYFRNFNNSNLISFLLKNTKNISPETLWSGLQFSEDSSINSPFFSDGIGACTLIHFIKFRGSFLSLVTRELETIVFEKQYSLLSEYVNLLTHSIGYSSDSSKVLELLDVTSFKPRANNENLKNLFSGFDFNYIFKNIELKSYPANDCQNPYDLSVVDLLVSIFGKTQLKNANFGNKEKAASFIMEAERIKKVITCSLCLDNFKWCLLENLQSWSKLTMFVAKEGFPDYSGSETSNFILETLQSVLPRIDEYLENDITYAETLVTMCVPLLYVYIKDKKQNVTSQEEIVIRSAIDARRLFSVFKICVRGIMSPISPPNLRSNLYTLAQLYLDETMINKEIIISADLLIFFRSVDLKFYSTILHDSIVGESSSRITSVFLLVSFLNCFSKLNTNDEILSGRHQIKQDVDMQIIEKFISDIFCTGTYLSSLVQKLKVTDEVFSNALGINRDSEGVSATGLLYEITSYKATMSLLIRLAQSRLGAQQLLQSDIYKTIRDCTFLKVDLDLGWELNIEECFSRASGSSKTSKIRLSLDNPVGTVESRVGVSATGDPTKLYTDNHLSVYEILIPVFQLITTIVITLGPQNEKALEEALLTEDHFERLIKSVLKRDVIFEEQSFELGTSFSDQNNKNSVNIKGIKDLTKLFTLLNALI